jgi:hypothetical protein
MRTNVRGGFVAEIRTAAAIHAASHCFATRLRYALYSADTKERRYMNKHQYERAVHTRGNGLTSKKERMESDI